VDAVITTRELGRMVRAARINWAGLNAEEQYDNPFGQATGAAVIFGTTGGVMEAALRTVAEIVTGKTLENLDFVNTRGKDGIKEFTVELPEITLKGAVVHGTGNAGEMLERIKKGEAEYHFIEFMGCPGGCSTGGGQPIVDAQAKLEKDVFELRAKAIYDEDKALPIRRSHENPFIKKLYDEYLEKPNSHKSHHLLHTEYTERVKYAEDLMAVK
jgi:NADP-reducing hydrogenase subunit HndD